MKPTPTPSEFVKSCQSARPTHHLFGWGSKQLGEMVQAQMDESAYLRCQVQLLTEKERKSVNRDERPLGDPEIAVEILKLRVAELEQAIRRLAEQDATLSVQGGNVTVTMDATLTDAEREAVLAVACHCDTRSGLEWARLSATLRGLLERMG